MVIALLFAIIQIFFCWCCFLSVLSKHHKITQSRVYRRINFRLLFQKVLAFNTWVVFLVKKMLQWFFWFQPKSLKESFSVVKLIFEADRRESFHNDDYNLRTLVVQVSWSMFRKIFALVRNPNIPSFLWLQRTQTNQDVIGYFCATDITNTFLGPTWVTNYTMPTSWQSSFFCRLEVS